MAGAGTKLWATAETVTATEFQTYLQDQIVGVFATTSARDAAWGGAGEPTLAEGAVAYIKDVNQLHAYSSAWVPLLDLDTWAADASGNYTIKGNVTLGVDGTGHDLICYGATSGAYLHWDEDVDDLVLAGDARLGVGIVATGTARLSVHGGLRFTATASAGDIYTGAGATGSDILGLCTAGTERMRIDAGGLVGIGIAPTGTAKLALHGGLRFTAAVAEGDIYTGIGATGSDLVGICTGGTERMTIASSGAVHVVGAFSKGSGSFDIAHPIKGGDWRLRHSFIEGPQADLIYRGTVTLSGGTAAIDLDDASNMTDGTWEVLCRDPWSMVASSGNAVEWSLSGKTLTITSDTADAVCSWMVIGERQDDHMKGDDCPLCDDDGHFVTEYERLQESAESSQQWTEANKAEEAEEAA